MVIAVHVLSYAIALTVLGRGLRGKNFVDEWWRRRRLVNFNLGAVVAVVVVVVVFVIVAAASRSDAWIPGCRRCHVTVSLPLPTAAAAVVAVVTYFFLSFSLSGFSVWCVVVTTCRVNLLHVVRAFWFSLLSFSPSNLPPGRTLISYSCPLCPESNLQNFSGVFLRFS